MAGAMPPFNEKVESWDSYKERLDNYFIATDVVDLNKKKAILLNSVGPSTFERVRNICYPSSVNDRLYDELLDVFSQLFTPAVVVFKERKTFYGVRKSKSETAADWYERIRRLAINCKFGVRTEEVLLDKFVTAFDGIVFEKFCNAGTAISLTEALSIAKIYETLDVDPKPTPRKTPQKNTEENTKTKKEDHAKAEKPKRQYQKKNPQDKK